MDEVKMVARDDSGELIDYLYVEDPEEVQDMLEQGWEIEKEDNL